MAGVAEAHVLRPGDYPGDWQYVICRLDPATGMTEIIWFAGSREEVGSGHG